MSNVYYLKDYRNEPGAEVDLEKLKLLEEQFEHALEEIEGSRNEIELAYERVLEQYLNIQAQRYILELNDNEK